MLPAKLNLGCGFGKREGWLNADRFTACEPDLLLDIEQTPWDLPTNAFDHVLMKHVLEHVGADFRDLTAIMQELYREIKPGGILEIHVPHHRHDTFWADPIHVRAFTPLTFKMMSKKQNREWMTSGGNYTMLAMIMNVDFEIEEALQVYDGIWQQRIDRGELTREQVRVEAQHLWNVSRELQFRLRVVKG